MAKISSLVLIAVTEEVSKAMRVSRKHVSRGQVVSSMRSQDGVTVVVSRPGVKVMPIVSVLRVSVMVGLGVSSGVSYNTGSRSYS